MKKLFSTPGRVVCSILALLVLLALMGGVIWFVVVRTAFVGESQAQAVALADAGLDRDSVSGLRAQLERDDGRFVYQVDFYHQGTEYEYTITADTGELIGRDIDGDILAQQTTLPATTAAQTAVTTTSPSQTDPPEETVTTQASTTAGGDLTQAQAQAVALADAGLTAEQVTFLSTQLEYDDGVQVYDIAFYTADREYDYEVQVAGGQILERSSEIFQIESDTNSAHIGIPQAQALALEHANLTAEQVQFTQAKLDYDDGVPEYEIAFYAGSQEYDYTIHAETGAVLECDVE